MEPSHYANALRAGFRGIFAKESNLAALKLAICAVHAGELWCDRVVTGNLLASLITSDPEKETMSQLSRRQRQMWSSS